MSARSVSRGWLSRGRKLQAQTCRAPEHHRDGVQGCMGQGGGQTGRPVARRGERVMRDHQDLPSASYRALLCRCSAVDTARPSWAHLGGRGRTGRLWGQTDQGSIPAVPQPHWLSLRQSLASLNLRGLISEMEIISHCQSDRAHIRHLAHSKCSVNASC